MAQMAPPSYERPEPELDSKAINKPFSVGQAWLFTTVQQETQAETTPHGGCSPALPQSKRFSTWSKSKYRVVRNSAIQFRDQPDLWKTSSINWLNVVINVATYALLVSDIPRSGTTTHVGWRPLAQGLYSFFGSYAYEIVTISKEFVKDGTSNFTASKDNHPVDHLRTWSYTFDTTSTGLRLITSSFNSSASDALRCMNYEIICDAEGKISIEDTFNVLDQVVDTVTIPGDPAAPVIYPSKPVQLLRRAQLVKTQHTYILYDKLSQWFNRPYQKRMVRVFHWPGSNVDSSVDVCADRHDRPYFCDAGPLYSGDPTDPESANVTLVELSVNERVRSLYQDVQTNRSDGEVVVDLTILEGYTEPWTYVGGLVLVVSAEFEIVVLTRARECSRNSLGQVCQTVRIKDYRYEGCTITTDLEDWTHVVANLRILAQGYYILRVVTLMGACHFAFPIEHRSWTRSAFLFLSEVPTHVVAYGSFIPVTMYACGVLIDGTTVSAIIHSGSVGLQGLFLTSLAGIYRLICVLMRRQWLMAFLTMIWVRLQATGEQFNRQNGIVSVRGHIFGILASMSMVVGYYHPSFRDTRVIGFAQANPHYSALNAHRYAREPSNRRLNAVYSDLVSIALCSVIYVVVTVLVRLMVRSLRELRAGKTSDVGGGRSQQRRRFSISQSIYDSIARKSFFVARTEMLPSTCNTLWNATGLTCAWANDLLISMAPFSQTAVRSLDDHARREMLLNIVLLSEPWTLVRLRLGLIRQQAFTYLEVETERAFQVIGKLTSDDPIFGTALEANKLQLVARTPVDLLAFHQLVRCR